MKTLIIATTAFTCLAGAAAAQSPPYSIANIPPVAPRARGPALGPAVAAAQAAIANCAAQTYKVTALIVDSAGVPVVMLSGEAAERTQYIAKSKIGAVMRYKMTSGEVAEKAKTDPKLAAEIKADPNIDTARQGAIPLMSGGQFIGAFAVSGAPGGDKDEACLRGALAKVPLN